MKFDWFVLPFLAGLVFVVIFTAMKFYNWIDQLDKEDKVRLRQHFLSRSILVSIKEIFNESLLHKKVFKANPVLGYMHLCFAFGWFLLIALGNIEIKFYSGYSINPPYVPIFLRYFEPTPLPHFFGRGSNFIMDLLLLMILSGVALAIFKRINSRIFGIKKSTTHNNVDKLAITSLWLIFPLRLLAESFTSGIYNNGSFLTGSLGRFFAFHLPVAALAYPTWWAYSFALGIFFFMLPFSRYMHILSEPMLIIFRNSGIKRTTSINSLSKAEINSCSRCGICIDTCQLNEPLGIRNVQPSYFIRDLRYKKLTTEVTENCLMCGRCNSACPVGIDSIGLRLAKRIENNNRSESNFSYPTNYSAKKADVLYFAGCMTHLTPAIKKSMCKILNSSGISWNFLDKDGTVCCGRPLLLSGQLGPANLLIGLNTAEINSSGAKTLVTSCPICYKAFREEYKLNIEVMHHTQFLLKLLNSGRIEVKKSSVKAIYHDPCELGRNSGVYDEPRQVIIKVADLLENKYSFDKSLCCGGSLGNNYISMADKKSIAQNALVRMNIGNADLLVTACPLCKKTFDNATNKTVADIAQLVSQNLVEFADVPKESYLKKEEKVLT
jgi:Fe-S oxidoreductase